MMGLYDSKAVLIADDGRTVTDRAEIAAALERDLRLGHTTPAETLHLHGPD
jgi:hypothetical protein